MLGRLSHIAVVVRDLEATVERFQHVLGAHVIEREHLRATGTDVAVLELGGAHIEFLSSRQPDTKVGRILQERGEGIHHLSFEVQNIEDQLAALRTEGVRLLDETPRVGVHGRKIAFLNPEETSGILIELVEENRSALHEEKG